MSTALYHLQLELYPSRAHARDGNLVKGQDPVVSPKTDIFTSALPAHRLSAWTSSAFNRPAFRSDHEHVLRTPELRPTSAGQDSNAGDALLLPERNQALKEINLNIPSSPKPSSEHASRDWRFGPVVIDSVDMELRHTTSNGGDKHSVKESGTTHTRGQYVPSSIKSTDAGWGVVHLYKDVQDGNSASVIRRNGKVTKEAGSDFDADKCATLCILAVPSWMMPSDLLGFVGDQTREDVSHFRLIRTDRANKYMVLMRFRSPKKAREWQKAWNGKLFSAMEPENCHVVFIKSVDFVSSDVQQASQFPQNNHDSFTAPSGASSIKPFAPPTPALIELPTCPVCLERMDETTGLLTILCQHVFHCACLEKWRGSGCPVCRYTQSPSSTFPYPRPGEISDYADTEPQCSVCASTVNLWICLICGSTGCGRYDSAHAYAHYEETSHCYAMDISDQHVWDYAGDGYVHRLIQNKEPALGSSTSTIYMPHRSGGGGGGIGNSRKPPHPNDAFRAEAEDLVPREKMETMANEYTFLLTSQLEGQRRYFEEQMQRAVDKASIAASRADEAAARLEDATARLILLEAERVATGEARDAAERASDATGRKAERFEKMAREAMAGLREEKTVSEGLMARIKDLEGKFGGEKEERERLVKELEEAKELNRDLTVFIEGRERLKAMEAEGEGLQEGEVEGGTVVIGQGKGKGRRKKR